MISERRSTSEDLSVPTIDFEPFLLGDPAGKQQVARAIRDACENTGFFYLTGHGVPQDKIDAAFEASHQFFALPLQERMKIKLIPDKNRGYQPVGSRMYPGEADAPDANESYKYQHELSADDPDIQAGSRVHAGNLWPTGLPGFRETLIGYYDCMEGLSDALLRAFALALDLDEGYFAAFYRKPLTQINLLHYPPHPASAKGRQFGLRPHTDTTSFTILAPGDVEGLQVECHGRWIDLPPIEGAYVINIGDMMARWTNDRFASTNHRVINRSGQERYSIPFFAIPDFDAVVECLPSCHGPDNPPKYQPLKVGDFMLNSNATDWSEDGPIS
ncbi:MAG: isopenicillin N synthase family oxygenase [Rhodospirillaceae bacterium]|nr:isopenicillin N synthase family oxygenase [Rhodospirillaceae bacterium]MBT6139983.1 isopenicillin N synthase family oxygenase [Rhodospirillaceae bacterium]